MISLVIYLIVIIFIISRFAGIRNGYNKKKTGNASSMPPVIFNNPRSERIDLDMPADSRKKSSSKGVNKDLITGGIGHKGISKCFYENETNNWLAYQLREEARAKAITDVMFNISRDYPASGDARSLKKAHLREHGKK